MSIRGKNTDQQRKEQRKHEQHATNQSQGLNAAQRKSERQQDPQLIRDFTEADIDDEWLDETAGEFLHRDQVLAITDERDQWEKKWLNRNLADKIIATYPPEEAAAASKKAEQFRRRMHGNTKRPLDEEEKQRIRSTLGEQKSDRESRSEGGRFLRYVLQTITVSEVNNGSDDSGGFWNKLLGGSS